jgi:hypothetical protein
LYGKFQQHLDARNLVSSLGGHFVPEADNHLSVVLAMKYKGRTIKNHCTSIIQNGIMCSSTIKIVWMPASGIHCFASGYGGSLISVAVFFNLKF